jgi:phage-related minor tail protein
MADGEANEPTGGGADERVDSPDEIEEWLAATARRISTAERLAQVTSVSEASEAVASVGGPEDVARLRTQLEADRKRLKRVATECMDLVSRAEDVEIPVETLRRLA